MTKTKRDQTVKLLSWSVHLLSNWFANKVADLLGSHVVGVILGDNSLTLIERGLKIVKLNRFSDKQTWPHDISISSQKMHRSRSKPSIGKRFCNLIGIYHKRILRHSFTLKKRKKKEKKRKKKKLAHFYPVSFQFQFQFISLFLM